MSRGEPETVSLPPVNRVKLSRQLQRECAHISRDIQEGVIIVLDRAFLITLVVHFKTCEFCLTFNKSVRLARSPVFSQLFIGYDTELREIHVRASR